MLFFIVLSLFAASGLGLDDFPQYQRTPLGDFVDKASMKIFKETFELANDKNVITSPLGIMTLLSMFSVGTEGEKKEEIRTLLGSGDNKQLDESYSGLSNRFNSMNSSYMVFANKMYVSDKFTIEDQFSNTLRRSYKSEVERTDFKQKKATADSINRWAGKNTKGHIKEVVTEDSLDEDTALALFNVIFFQGHWDMPFKAKNTVEQDFYVNASYTVKKPMMRLFDSLLYHEDAEIGAKMVELPYTEKGFRMIIVLPDAKDGLAGVVEKLAEKGLLESVFALKNTWEAIRFEMPKFEVENNIEFDVILSKVGVSRIFNEGSHGVVRGRDVTVSRVFQRALVKVDEEGATAGAFSGLFARPVSGAYLTDSVQFKADRPFLFAILHEDIVLFTGTYSL